MAGPGGVEIDPRFLPTLSTPEERKPARGWFKSGLSAGVDEFQGLLGSAVQGGGKLAGATSVENFGRSVARDNIAEAAANGRPDLEIAPWKTGSASVLPWLGYQTAKQLPIIATYLAGGKGFRKFGGTAPQALEDIATSIPRSLGGGGLMPGASVAVRRAAVESGARQAGKDLASELAGGSIAGLPLAFGSMVQEADSKPGGVTAQDVKKAALLSPVYSALDALQPAGFKGLLQRGQTGNIIRRIATAAFAGAAAEVPQEGIQTALEQSFRPDLSAGEKFTNIVDAAVTGGAIGGLFGGVGGIRGLKRVNPTEFAQSPDAMAAAVDEAIQLRLPGPTMYVNQGGEAAQGQAGFSDLTAPRLSLPGPGDIDSRSAIEGSTMISGRNRDGGRFAPGSSTVEQPPVASPARSFQGWTTPELTSALNVLSDKQQAGKLKAGYSDLIAPIQSELEFRKSSLTQPGVAGQSVGAALPETERRRGTTDQVSEAPASTNLPWTSQRDDLLKGIATRKWYHEAETAEDLDRILVARLEDGSTAKSDLELAKRRGIDVNAPSAPVEATPARASEQAPETPVAGEEFTSRWKADVSETGQKDKGARALKPTSEADAQRQIYQALGAKTEIGDGLERLAQKYGILDEQKRLTPAAVAIAQKDPIPTKEAVKAAVLQGFNGAEASSFDRGVQAYTGQGTVVERFENDAAQKAYQAGQDWAAARNSVPSGALKKYDAAPVSDSDVAQIAGTAKPQPRVVPPEAKPTQDANLAIDATRAAFASPEDDVAELKRRVRSGDVDGAMQGLLKVQRGERLFQQPEPGPREPFVGARIDATSRALSGMRGQASGTIFADNAARSRSKPASRAEAERAIRKYEMHQAIDRAVAEGKITSKERIGLVVKLNRGQIAEVLEKVPVDFTKATPRTGPTAVERKAQIAGFVSDLQDALIDAQLNAEVEAQELKTDANGVLRNPQVKTTRRQFLTGVAAAAAIASAPHPVRAATSFEGSPVSAGLRSILENGSSLQSNPKTVLEYIKKTSSDPAYRMIATKLLRGDWSKATIFLNGDSDSDRGSSRVSDDGQVFVELWGDDGMNEQTVVHELIHAYVQLRWAGLSVYNQHNKDILKDTKDRSDTTITLFNALHSRIQAALMRSNPDLVDQEIWANQVFEDPDEMLSWVLTNPDAQAYLKAIDSEGHKIEQPKAENQKSLWDHILDFFARLFGTNDKQVRSALDEVLSAGYAVLDAGVAVDTNDFAPKMAAALKRQHDGEPLNLRKRVAKQPADFNEKAKKIVGQVNGAMDRLGDVTQAGLKALIGAMPLTHIVKQYKSILPGAQLLFDAHADRRASTSVLAHLYDEPKTINDRLSQTPQGRKAIERTHEAMEATAWDINPRVSWEQNEHLHELDNAALLKRKHAEFSRLYNLLKKDGHNQLYDAYASLNEMENFASMAMGIRQLVVSDPTLASAMPFFNVDPMEVMRNDAKHHTPQAARTYWRKVLDDSISSASGYFDALRGAGNDSEMARLSPLEMYLRLAKRGVTSMDSAPYFHLGRHGEHFVSAQVRLGADKKVDGNAVEHVAKELEKIGITDARVTRDLDKPTVYLRLETKAQRDEAAQLFLQLQRQGWLRKDVDVLSAPRDEGEWLPERTKAEMKKFINALEARFEPTDDMSDEEKSAAASLKTRVRSIAYDTWLNMLPDGATSKVMTHRESKPGYSKDMGRNFAFRYNIGVNSLANMAAEPYIDHAFEKMRAKLNDAKRVSTGQDVDAIKTIYGELAQREENLSQMAGDTSWDKWRALTHSYFLGASPSYFLINLTQMGVTLWPELAKKHGFMAVAKAIGRATSIATKIMTETAKQGYDVGGALRAADTIITPKVLKDAVGNDALLPFLRQMIGSGIIDIGSHTRELGTIAEGREESTLRNVTRLAGAAGLYSETVTRLIAAIAAHDLHQGDLNSKVEYAKDVVRESMFEYSTYNVPRLMGKMGMFGKFTPVMAQFMQYSTQLTFKLYRELDNSFGKQRAGETSAQHEARRKEGRKFMMNHLSAVTLLAGTLGLPFATVGAAVLEHLVDAWDDDDEPYDASAAWRNYLAEMFGPDVAEMIARGVPRGMGQGFDLSQRAGEQDLLPFSQWLTDRREMQDASSEAALRSLGAPVGMALNIYGGLEKMAAGDMLGGMAQLLPQAMKGPTQAFRMYEDGYKDTLGNKLPMTPKASAYLFQLLGLNPQAKAEYSEARSDQASRKGVLVREANRLRSGILDALTEGDQETAVKLIREAQKFGADNPGFDVLGDIEGSLSRRAKAQATAGATRTPIGVSVRDPGGQQLTGYANIDYQAQ